MVERLSGAINLVERLTRAWLPRELLLWPPMLGAEVLGVVVLFRLCQRSLPSADFRGDWTTVIMLAIWFLIFSVVLALGRFIALWSAIARMTREFLSLPMAQAYDRIPPMYTRSFGRYLDRITPSLLNLGIPVRQWAVVAGSFHRVADDLGARFLEKDPAPPGDVLKDPWFRPVALAITRGDAGAAGNVPAGPEAAAGIIAIYQGELLGLQAGGDGEAAEGGRGGSPSGARSEDDVAWSRTWEGLRNAARACVDVLDPIWLSRTPAEGYRDRPEPRPVGETAGAAHDSAAGRVGPEKPADGDPKLNEWVRAAEDLIALQVVALVSQSTVQLKGLAYYLAAAPVLLLMAVSSYPFQPQRFLQVCLWAVLVMVTVGVIWVYVRMEKDEFISRVSRTDPNRISLDRTFLGNLLAFFIPLIGVALAQFPFMSDTLNQWFEPITRVLK